MIVVNKKFKVIVITLLILLEVASTYLMYRSFNNRNIVLDNVKLKGTNKSNGLAIMLEQEDGTYKESASNAWPEEMMYNEEKSGCIDSNGKKIENSLTYEGGIATVNTNTTSYCYLYFDLIKDDVTIAVSTDGESGLMPSNGAYTNSATCSSGNITWSDKYQRIEIGNLTKVGNKCNIAFTKDTSDKALLRNEVEEVNSSNNYNSYGYRYSGKTPNNYIWFNNEMWRIIGSIPTCLSASCGTNTTNLVKIIRNDSIGTISYALTNTTTAGAWINSNIKTVLNNYYYGALNATDTDYCYGGGKINCDYTQIGIKPNSYYGKMVKSVYWNTGGSLHGNTVAATYADEILTRTFSGYVGLITMSDYGYATINGYFGTSLGEYQGYPAAYNWLYTGEPCPTSIQMSSSTNYVNWIDSKGNLAGTASNGAIGGVRPVVYLDSSVYIISGTGTEADPYVIGM